MRNERGFTLIELLVVVAIIGLLSTMGVIAFRSAQLKARDTKRVGDIKLAVSGLVSGDNEGRKLCLYSDGVTCGGAIGASIVKLSAVSICDSCSGGVDRTTEYANLHSLRDPLSSGKAACSGSATQCDYGVMANSTMGNFELYFYTEAAIPAFNTIGAHKANKNGILE